MLSTLRSLPSLPSLADCAQWSKTATPYWSHLETIPKQLQAVRSIDALWHVYTSNNPLMLAIAFSLAVGVIVLVAAEINRNYSQIDRLWSILPTVYNAHYCYWANLNGMPAKKLDLVLMASTVWSARLTYNYWRRGGYMRGSEDYRWEIIQKRIGWPAFHLLNFTFISFGQSLLLCFITAPTYILLNTTNMTPATLKSADDPTDLYWAVGILLLVSLEYTADQQQWVFHQAKHEYQKTARVNPEYGHARAELDRGFLSSGLFALSRHPNYACEMAIWVTLYAWSCYATEQSWNWAIIPVISYIGIFLSSTPLTEHITSSKYPEYKDYQKSVGIFLPDPIKMLRGGFQGVGSKKRQ